ncbi:MAG: rhomboid family intramembrane serine protease [Lachnospiraceae bacterium]|nr:rhomboid family intramembrane serine protease [Lachnospiraceae bacterium]
MTGGNTVAAFLKRYPQVLLIAANVAAFICGLIFPAWYNAGMMNAFTVFDLHEYYRILTAMFLHGGIRHLVMNMLFLFFIADLNMTLQEPWKFWLVYFASGILGGYLTELVRHLMGSGIWSVGASGAILGLLGSTLALFILQRGRIPEAMRRSYLIRIGILAALNLIPGENGTDYLGHLCGFVVGFLLTLLLGGRRTAGDPV